MADLSNNRAIACANGINPLQVFFFEDNAEFPSFNVFILETGTFTLSFDEPVDIVNVNYTLITLMSQASGGSSIILTFGQAVSESAFQFHYPTCSESKNLTLLAVNQDSKYFHYWDLLAAIMQME